MKTLATLTILTLGSALIAAASIPVSPAPEIEATSAMSAVTLLAGAVLVFRSRRKK